MARILIADDDDGAREMLGRICEYHGHEVESVPDAARAQVAYRKNPPDLLIVDLAMPRGGGQTMLDELRPDIEKDGCPVIVVSGYVDVLGESEKKALGAAAILRKPVEVQPMLDAVEAALKTRS